MTLGEYLERTGTSRAEFARQIDVKHITVTRYLSGRIPEPRVMERIIEVTGNCVTANDFFRVAA